jgi:hypothetical protein
VQWERTFNGERNGRDEAIGLCPLGDGGACVTGRTGDDGSDGDVFTLCYDEDGDPLWAAYYDGPDHRSDLGTQIVTDDLSFAVLARSRTAANDHDLVTLRYDSLGNLVGHSRFASAPPFDEQTAGLAFDAGGAILVGGTTRGPTGTVDFISLKYSCCTGDFDGDGAVGLSDLTIQLAHFGAPSGATHADGDVDGDGDVDIEDLASLLGAFGIHCR